MPESRLENDRKNGKSGTGIIACVKYFKKEDKT